MSPHDVRYPHASYSSDNGAPLRPPRATFGYSFIAIAGRYLRVCPNKLSATYSAYSFIGASQDTRLLESILDLCLLATIEERDGYGRGMAKNAKDRGFPVNDERCVFRSCGVLRKTDYSKAT